jgi:hypothetical protein
MFLTASEFAPCALKLGKREVLLCHRGILEIGAYGRFRFGHRALVRLDSTLSDGGFMEVLTRSGPLNENIRRFNEDVYLNRKDSGRKIVDSFDALSDC